MLRKEKFTLKRTFYLQSLESKTMSSPRLKSHCLQLLPYKQRLSKAELEFSRLLLKPSVLLTPRLWPATQDCLPRFSLKLVFEHTITEGSLMAVIKWILPEIGPISSPEEYLSMQGFWKDRPIFTHCSLVVETSYHITRELLRTPFCASTLASMKAQKIRWENNSWLSHAWEAEKLSTAAPGVDDVRKRFCGRAR